MARTTIWSATMPDGVRLEVEAVEMPVEGEENVYSVVMIRPSDGRMSQVRCRDVALVQDDGSVHPSHFWWTDDVANFFHGHVEDVMRAIVVYRTMTD